VSTQAGAYRFSWLLPLIDQDRAARRQSRALERRIDELLDAHGTTLRDEAGIGPIASATLLAEVGDPFRVARESKFARWSGTGAVALSPGEGDGPPVRHRLDIGGNRRITSVLYIASVTQQRDHAYIDRKTTEGKTPREARRAHKRHLANRVIRRMWADERRPATAHPKRRLTRERPTTTPSLQADHDARADYPPHHLPRRLRVGGGLARLLGSRGA
jgi:hypothetical protein